jgi:hypothetical protein
VRAFLWERMRAEVDRARVAKFREPSALHIVVAGGTAGRFSAWVPGWAFRSAPRAWSGHSQDRRLNAREVGGAVLAGLQ